MGKAPALVALLVTGYAATLASATMYTVGDGQGWNTGVDYTRWARDKAFVIGDGLVFDYQPWAHTVTEVSKSDYDNCYGRNPLRDYENGNTVVNLDTPGWHYFICNVPGHCAEGMKLAVLVSSTPTGATPSGVARGALVPAMGSVVAVVAGAAINLALL